MKLRSESRALDAFKLTIPFMLPATHEIFISNASSPLLRLPQELKDCIYHFVYAGFYIHVKDPCNGFRLAVCNILDQHNSYYCTHLSQTRLQFASLIASLTTCRQMYHDARNVLYSANTFQIANARSGRLFLQRLSDRCLTLRSLHLDVFVAVKQDERDWDYAFHEVAEDLKNLQRLYINFKEELWNGLYYNAGRHSPAFGKKPFLGGLLELKKLPLKTFEIVIDETTRYVRNIPERDRWTVPQKLVWAQSIKSAVLGTDLK